MKMMNRCAIVVRPAAPYMAWARLIAGEEAGPIVWDAADHDTVFLLDEIEIDDYEQAIADHHPEMFDRLLNNWHRDPRVWPKNRTEAMFREWFQIRTSDLVFDLRRPKGLREKLSTAIRRA